MKLRSKLMIIFSLISIGSSITVFATDYIISEMQRGTIILNHLQDIIIIEKATVIGIIFIITIFLANYFSKTLSNPISVIRKISHKIASNEFDITLDIKSHDEVEDLAKDIEHMSKELKKSYDRLKSESELKNQFINIAAHELRSPIQPILSYIDLYKKGLVGKEDTIKIISSESQRLQKLTNDILDIARIESGTFRYNMQKVGITEIIRKVCDLVRPFLNKDVELELGLEENVKIDGDPDKLYQAFANLIGNAAKFTKKGKIKVETRLLPQKVEIKISDTAGGIPQEILPRLFEKFATKNVGDEQSQGTGLGLFISKAIVAAHKGEISAHNNDQGGATFTISLPNNTNLSNQ